MFFSMIINFLHMEGEIGEYFCRKVKKLLKYQEQNGIPITTCPYTCTQVITFTYLILEFPSSCHKLKAIEGMCLRGTCMANGTS